MVLIKILCICIKVVYIGVLVKLLTEGVRIIPESFCQQFESFSSDRVALSKSRLEKRLCAQSYCKMLCHVWSIYQGGLFFSEGKQRRSIYGGDIGTSGGRGNCRQDEMNERRISKQIIKKQKQKITSFLCLTLKAVYPFSIFGL